MQSTSAVEEWNWTRKTDKRTEINYEFSQFIKCSFLEATTSVIVKKVADAQVKMLTKRNGIGGQCNIFIHWTWRDLRVSQFPATVTCFERHYSVSTCFVNILLARMRSCLEKTSQSRDMGLTTAGRIYGRLKTLKVQDKSLTLLFKTSGSLLHVAADRRRSINLCIVSCVWQQGYYQDRTKLSLLKFLQSPICVGGLSVP